MKKRIASLLIAAATVVSSISIANVVNTNAATTTVNHALTATVTTSSNENASLSGANAIDGNLSTRWSSNFSDGQWIQLDFGKTVTIGAVNINWEDAYARKYTISWSNDGENWNTAVTRQVSKKSDTTDMFFNRPVRYIRVTAVTRATQYGVSIFEIQALGDVTVEDTTTQETTTVPATTQTQTTSYPRYPQGPVVDLAQGATATASSEESSLYAASKAVDGDMNTRWSSEFRNNEYLTIDIGEVCAVGSVVIYWEAAYAETYSISWSQDGINWTQATTMGVGKVYNAETSDMFYNRPCRYIRIKGDKRATQYGISIYEVKLLGIRYNSTPATTVAPTTVAPTTQQATTVSNVAPLEVIGAVVSSPRSNTIGVVWGQDNERINSGCKYNVYVNGVKKLDNVNCNYYELTNIASGTANVVIKSVLNNVESNGVSYNVNVQ